jgi:hypothetical protein
LDRIGTSTSKMEILMTISLIILMATLGTVTFNASHAQQITPEQKAQMCNPNNPKLNFVNSTESEICGIPESIKNQTTMDNSSAVSSQPIAPSAVSPRL